MYDPPPHVDVIQGPSVAADLQQDRPRHRSQRLLTFFIVFTLCATIGLGYTFARQSIYRATASLLTVAMPAVDQPGAEADLQHIAIQRQLLLGRPLLENMLTRIETENYTHNIEGIPQLLEMLFVVPVTETNIVELRAEGPEPKILPFLVNAWIDSYLEMRAREIRESTGTTTDALREQYQAISARLQVKRRELDRFRQENNILTMGRDENQALTRLQGLTTALNTASEEEVRAKARLDAMRKASAEGKPVVPREERTSLTALESRAQQLREQLTELDRRYTRDFLALQPNLKVIPKQLAELEEEIKRKVNYGQRIVLAEAEQEWAAARQSVSELQAQLAAHKKQASDFTARFAEHEALQQDLARLEELYRTTEERLVQIEVQDRQRFPQVKVLERAHPPIKPVWPNYWRDAAIAVIASLLLALFAVWIIEYLTRRGEKSEIYPMAGVRVFTGGQRQPAITPPVSTVSIMEQKRPALQHPACIELDVRVVRQIFEQADVAGRQLIALLLTGLTLEEVSIVDITCFDFANGKLRVSGAQGRTLSPAPAVLELFADAANLPVPGRPENTPLSPDDLQAKITLAVVDAGLDEPNQVNADSLRLTYLAYLVRQGAKLTEVETIVGGMPATLLASYARLSPAGPGRPLQEIDLIYPLFK